MHSLTIYILYICNSPGKFRSPCFSSLSCPLELIDFFSNGGSGGSLKGFSGGGRKPGREGKWGNGRLNPGKGGRLGKDGLEPEPADCRIESMVNPLAAHRRWI